MGLLGASTSAVADFSCSVTVELSGGQSLYVSNNSNCNSRNGQQVADDPHQLFQHAVTEIPVGDDGAETYYLCNSSGSTISEVTFKWTVNTSSSSSLNMGTKDECATSITPYSPNRNDFNITLPSAKDNTGSFGRSSKVTYDVSRS